MNSCFVKLTTIYDVRRDGGVVGTIQIEDQELFTEHSYLKYLHSIHNHQMLVEL